MVFSRIPLATYRLQLNEDFRFVDAEKLIDYLHALGISDLYCSPCLEAGKGSTHGYDIVNPSHINPDLGGEAAFDSLCVKLRKKGMGLLLDIVPNHMAAGSENPWWRDVLENGPSSPYARFFDIDWKPTAPRMAILLENKVLVPVLGEPYGIVLENREILLGIDEQGLHVRYWDAIFPLDPKTYRYVLTRALEQFKSREGEVTPALKLLRRLIHLCDKLPERTTQDQARIRLRQTAKEEIKLELWQAYLGRPFLRNAIDAVMQEMNGRKGFVESFDQLDELLSQQGFRLAWWKTAAEEINYRRFFDINNLVCLRVNDEEVFRARHQRIIHLVRRGRVTGLRVDHIDGIRDPLGYLGRLQEALSEDEEGSRQNPALYMVVEKVLGRDETLPEAWPVAGTTGYDFLNAVNEVFLQPEGFHELESFFRGWVDAESEFASIRHRCSKQIMKELFAGELNSLAAQLDRLAAGDRRARDILPSDLKRLLTELTACLPVYRCYLRDFHPRTQDKEMIEQTLARVRQRVPEEQIGPVAFSWLRRVLLLDRDRGGEDQRKEWLRFIMRWQQFTGPVMAKGLEDTAFYVHNTLLSLNEVGGDPSREAPPMNLLKFHEFNRLRHQGWPHALNATSTHDTKRSEDVRARINVLSEVAPDWERRLESWKQMNRGVKRRVNGLSVPTPNEEILLYQTLVGAWPLEESELPEFRERLYAFLVKACREAKVHSNWIRPDREHESGLISFAKTLLEESHSSAFRNDFIRFQRKIAYWGALTSLSQLLLKIASPGVPDFYQGTELWSFSLVDPDNRRPVDFERRIRLLQALRVQEARNRPDLPAELLRQWQDGRLKLYITYKALSFRRSHRAIFLHGDYLPIEIGGPRMNHVCAFARRQDHLWVIAVAPRWVSRLAPGNQPPLGEKAWADTALSLPTGAPGLWYDVLTGESQTISPSPWGKTCLNLKNVLQRFPVALLASDVKRPRRS